MSSQACHRCDGPIERGERFCARCGMSVEAETARICPKCLASYEADDRFCMIDGSPLTSTGGALGWRADEFRSQARSIASGAAAQVRKLDVALAPFWRRHKALLIVTGIGITPLIAIAAGAEVPPLIGLVLAIALFLGWGIAVSRAPGALRMVERMDEWFGRSQRYTMSSAGKLRKFVLFPVLWVSGKLIEFTGRIADPYSAAGLRTIGYVLTFSLIGAIVIFAVMFVVALAMIGICLWVATALMGEAPSPGGRALDTIARTGAGRLRGKVIRNKDGFFGKGEQTGRIGEDGQIYGPDGWFGKGEQVGRVGDDGQIYGKDTWFGKGEQVGRIDDDGQLRGPDGWFGKGDPKGRIDDDGQVRGPDGFFGKGNHRGRLTDD